MSITRIKSYGLSDGAVTTEKISNNVSLGVKISNIQIANSAYSVLDDTAVALEGGYIIITGAGFAAGCQVIVGANTATSTTFVNSTTLRAQVGAADAGTKTVYVVNTDGGTAIRVNGLTYSATPTWVTGSTLTAGVVDSPVNTQLSASGATSYQLQAGSSLPAGLTLAANGLLTGTVTGIEEETTYSFTIEAIDAENQESPRSFSITISLGYLVDYLVVAGGGGGAELFGGGGAGGFVTGTSLFIDYGTSITITVGAGGAGGTSEPNHSGSNGTNSQIITTNQTVTAIGGGGGGGGPGNAGRSGGSGGGGSGWAASLNPGGSGTVGQGNNGGASTSSYDGAGGGGGGAGSVGQTASSTAKTAGSGGQGQASSITGISVVYAGGGGGSVWGGAPSAAVYINGLGGSFPSTVNGSKGGGGDAGGASLNPNAYSSGNQAGQAGSTNTGGGGGAAARNTPSSGSGGPGGSGGSGVVILKYPNTYTISNPAGGLTFTTSTAVAGYKVTTFTAGTGNIQFN